MSGTHMLLRVYGYILISSAVKMSSMHVHYGMGQ